MPELVAMVAASILVAMPPVPTPLLVPRSRTPLSSATSRTSVSGRAPGRLGSAVYRPSTSDSSTRASACTRWATRAASRSLSPKRISWVATVSFSFTIGMTPSASSRSSVRLALR
jgi:hypothetical protein